MSSPQGETPQDTPLSVIPPSPADMPGAYPVVNAPVETMPKPPETPAVTPEPKPEGEAADDRVELERFKAVQKIAREMEKTAKANLTDAEAFRKLQDAFKTDGTTAADPLREIQQLREELQSEKVERQRAEVARLTGVPPHQISGNDQESMTASAQAALEWAKGLQQSTQVPLVAPAESVTTTTPTHENGVKQIASRDELKGMSSKDIMAAYTDGRLDNLLGRPTQ